MRVNETERAGLQKLYGGSLQTLYVYENARKHTIFAAYWPDQTVPKLHKLNNGYTLVGPLDLATGSYGHDAASEKPLGMPLWAQVLILVGYAAARLALILAAVGGLIFFLIASVGHAGGGHGANSRRRH